MIYLQEIPTVLTKNVRDCGHTALFNSESALLAPESLLDQTVHSHSHNWVMVFTQAALELPLN